MDTRRLVDLIRFRDALLDAEVLMTAADRLEQQKTEIVSLTRRLRDMGRELLLAEAHRLRLEAMNRELLARCDLLSCELIQAGRAFPLRKDRTCDQASS